MTEKVSIEKISAGRKQAKAKDKPDPQDRMEIAAAEKAEAEAQSVREGNRDRRALRDLRFKYAKKVYRFLICYCIGAAIIVILDGFNTYGFEVDGSVLMIIVGSTAASAIGLVGFVVNGLFSSR